MRIFFDTNVLASAFTARGLCADLYELAALNHHLIIGEPVVEELLRVLSDKLRVPPDKLATVRRELDEFDRAPRSDRPRIHFPRDPRPTQPCSPALSTPRPMFSSPATKRCSN